MDPTHGRKSESDELSFMPPYSEQAKYIELANAYLFNDAAGPNARNEELEWSRESEYEESLVKNFLEDVLPARIA